MITPFLIPLEALLHADRLDATPVAVCGGTIHDFGAFKAAVGSLAARIGECDGHDWLVACEDGWELAVALFAVLYAGRRPVLPANHQAGHLAAIGGDVDGVIGLDLPGKHCLSISGSGADASPNAFDPTVAEIVLHTSGSSGLPEAFIKPFVCLQAEVETLHATFAKFPNYTILATVPAYHIYGLLFRILWPLAAGWKFDGDMVRYPEEILPRLAEAENCLLVSSPAFLKRSVDVIEWSALANLKGVFSSGGPLMPEIGAAYNQQLAHPLYEVYGSTETGGIGYRAVHDASVRTNWTPLTGVALSLDEESRLRVSSKHILEGVFQTEDLADLGSDGTFFLKGRADRILKIEERRISLSEIESRLQSMDEVAEAKCVPLEGQKRTVVSAVIRPSETGWGDLRRNGKAKVVQKFRQALKDYISPVGVPRKWRFVSELPQNAQGKVTYLDMQALFQPGSQESIEPQILNERVDGAVADVQLEIVPDLIWFDGHFPIAPILPGLAQITWAQDISSRLFEVGEKVERLEVVKFFEVISPGTALKLTLEFQREKSRVLFRYWSDKGEHAKGRIVFSPSTVSGNVDD